MKPRPALFLRALALASLGLAGCMSPPQLAPLSIPTKGSVARIEVEHIMEQNGSFIQPLKHTITDPIVIGQIVDELNRMNGPMHGDELPFTESTVDMLRLNSTLVFISNGAFPSVLFSLSLTPNSIGGSTSGEYGHRDVPKEQMIQFYKLIGVPYPK